jgi:hypothetical protein
LHERRRWCCSVVAVCSLFVSCELVLSLASSLPVFCHLLARACLLPCSCMSMSGGVCVLAPESCLLRHACSHRIHCCYRYLNARRREADMGMRWSSSCLISGGSSANRQDMMALLVRIPGVSFAILPPAPDAAGKQESAKFKGDGSGDRVLEDLLVKLQRQPPHAQGNKHKLAVITPFRDGCTAMSQVRYQSLSLTHTNVPGTNLPLHPNPPPAAPLCFSLSPLSFFPSHSSPSLYPTALLCPTPFPLSLVGGPGHACLHVCMF